MNLKKIYERAYNIWGYFPGAKIEEMLVKSISELLENPQNAYEALGDIYLDYLSHKNRIKFEINFPSEIISKRCINKIIEENNLIKKLNEYKELRINNDQYYDEDD